VTEHRLYRSPNDRVIAGVAGGLAVWLNIDPSLVRIAWVLLAIFSGGIFVLVYFVMMIVVPLPPPGWMPPPMGGPAPGGWGSQDPGVGGWPGQGAPPPPGTAPGGAPGTAPGAVPGWTPPDATQPGWTPPANAWSSPPPGWTGPSRPIGGGNAGIVVGVILVGLGIWFLIDQYISIDWSLLWPAIVIVLGVGLIVAALQRGRTGSG
jgi:phage shock protein C